MKSELVKKTEALVRKATARQDRFSSQDEIPGLEREAHQLESRLASMRHGSHLYSDSKAKIGEIESKLQNIRNKIMMAEYGTRILSEFRVTGYRVIRIYEDDVIEMGGWVYDERPDDPEFPEVPVDGESIDWDDVRRRITEGTIDTGNGEVDIQARI